jgi:hypothetical protein
MSDLGWRADGIERAIACGGVPPDLYLRPGFTGTKAIRRADLNPFEIDRLGWEEFRGIPMKPDEKLGTGCFRLVCEGSHGKALKASAKHQQIEVPA